MTTKQIEDTGIPAEFQRTQPAPQGTVTVEATKQAKPRKAASPAAKLAAAHNSGFSPETIKEARAAKRADKKVAAKREVIRTPANPQKSIVPMRFKAQYAEHNDTNGSRLSMVLKEATTTRNEDGREALDVPALFAIAKAHGIDTKPYEKLNNGQKRMNVRNKLAGLLKGGKKVTIGKTVLADAGKALATPAPTGKALEAKVAAAEATA